MSRTIDSRTVEMKFDTDNFEKGVDTVAKGVKKVNESLNDLGSDGKSSLDGIGTTVESISDKFSVLGAVGFTVLQNITNKANQFKNASTTTSSTLELEEVQTSKDDAVSTSFDYTDTSTITYNYKKGTTEGQLSAVGLYGLSEEAGTGLTYKEFYPNNFQFEVEAEDIEENE